MDAVLNRIQELVSQHGKGREKLLPILQGIVQQENYISDYAMVTVAKELDISAAEVYGTASFYSFLDHDKAGKYIVRVCKTITCSMKGKNQLLMAIQDMLKIKMGETSTDGMFTLMETNCLGLCHKGPAMLINNEMFIEMTPEKVREVLSVYLSKDNK